MATQELELPVTPTQLVRRCAGEPFVCALDGGDVRSWGVGRALLGFRPRATLRVSATGDAMMRDGREQQWYGHPFDLLDRFCAAAAAPARSAEPFAGGVVAALSYDLRHWVERLPARSNPKFNEFMLRFGVENCTVTLFADGRAIVQGTSDPAVARGVYAKYIGS